MARQTNLKLLADFFNKIGQSRHFRAAEEETLGPQRINRNLGE